jgi:hypothetical protein
MVLKNLNKLQENVDRQSGKQYMNKIVNKDRNDKIQANRYFKAEECMKEMGKNGNRQHK